MFINREASWLSFNRRVLEEAQDPRNPLLERVKFLAITASNLDEFFEVRVASILQRIEDGFTDGGPDGLSPISERDLIARESHSFVAEQYQCWNKSFIPELAEQGIRVLELKDLDAKQRTFIHDYCQREVDPVLTPVTVDPAHPFPRVINKALCLAFSLRKRRRSTTYMGVLTVPRLLPRIVKLPSSDGLAYIFLADLLTAHASRLYRGYEVVSAASFRVTRNSNLYVQEEEARSLLESVTTELHNRRKGDAVRLEIDAEAAPEIVERLQSTFDLDNWQVFRTDGPVNLNRLLSFYELAERPDLKYRPFVPRELATGVKNHDVFAELRKRDVLLHHPFDSYSAVVDFIEGAAEDPQVVSVKQTIYRTSQDSPIGQALIEAAAEKEVTVVMELTARFDEASNIRWARNLADAGVQVFHGLVGLKTHCKLALLVRRDPDGRMRRYVHIGTGNYNPVTSRFYTDVSLLTANPRTTAAVHEVFNYLTAHSEAVSFAPLVVSPINFAQTLLAQINREAENAAEGKPASIIAKMNALLDKNVIQALYRASQAGVRIELIVRGMCALRPGVPGISENITVRSIVGRFLEHSRVWRFENGGDPEYILSSGDWMPRNFYERVEVCCPIKDPVLQQRISNEILSVYLADTCKVRFLQADASYARFSPEKLPAGVREFNAQEFLIALSEGKATVTEIPRPVSLRKRAPRKRTRVERRTPVQENVE